MYANYDNLKIAFEEYSIKQDLECEKYIFENADGIVTDINKVCLLIMQKIQQQRKNTRISTISN